MTTWKLTLEYHGAAFCGWQRQPEGTSVQQVLEDALATLHGGAPVRVTGAGRTDAGVHARGQVASFDAPSERTASAYTLGLESLLPPRVAVREAAPAPEGFDARRWALGKRYIYRILRSRLRSPLRDDFVWRVSAPLDAGAMREAALHMLGRRDFTSFRAAGCTAKTAVRELRRVDVKEAGDEMVFVLEGDAFLRHMVRNIVGTLVDVGRGRHPPAWVEGVLAGLDRRLAGPTAPAQGLCLDEVFYGRMKDEG